MTTASKTRKTIASALFAVSTLGSAIGFAADKPTVILVHGAFAESASWNGVAARLIDQGYPVVAAANPLRGVANDAKYVSNIIEHTSGPIVLVGHSYGGSVITNAVKGSSKVKALVYVAAFAPATGESAATLAGKFPGGTLGPTLAAPVQLSDGNQDLYIQQDKFAEQFAADVAPAEAALMAATQRPITAAALNEESQQVAWDYVPSWFVYGTGDKNIPEAALKFMADRAGSKKTVNIPGASHVVMTSHPDEVAALIAEAAEATTK
ncbi:alpha/beta fold hydrolase [Stutzerimonas stutzeri]|uniref:Alpha/beta hydrolase n=1 Tax=Stutzerimonas stutzeri TaxID=316 RepID=A0A0D9AMS1_STUST|nr:alpha/beta fold hydrolase [Stutzerimonas stutzeri]KJH82335.1 alpha/beta hydrolase [Stutzerimonas stutzeri]